jgi:hypothetical protein
MAGKALLTVGTIVLTLVLVGAVALFFVSRDESTVPHDASRGPGVARAGAVASAPKVTAGNVVLLHSDERLTKELRDLAGRIAGPSDPSLVAAGQAVIEQQFPNLSVPVTAVTATRMLEASGPGDPALESFIEYWLGRTS